MVYREGEEEMVAELEDALLQRELGPDELHVGLAQEAVLGAQVRGGLHLEEVAVWVHGLAVDERHGVDGDDKDMVKQVFGSLAGPKALAEQAEQRVRPRPNASLSDVMITVLSSVAISGSSSAKPLCS